MRLFIALLMAALLPTAALAGGATTTAVPNTGTTNVMGFTCFSTEFCTAHVNIDNTGTETGTAGNPFRVNPTGTTAQPVTGTFWQTTQPVSGTFWQATQPVSIAGTIPSSAASGAFVDGAITTIGTEADTAWTGSGNTTVLGALKGLYTLTNTALIPSAPLVPGTAPSQGIGVLCYNGSTPTVGSAQTVALQCNSTGQLVTTAGNVAQAAAIAGLTGPMMQGEYLATPPTYSDSTVNPILTDINGNVLVNVAAGAAANSAASATGAAVPADAGYTGVHVGANLVGQTGTTISSTTAADTNVAMVGGAAVAVGHGTAAGSQRVELPTDGTGQVAISQGTPGTTNGVSPVLTTAGGWTPKNLAGLTNTATAIKTSAGQLGMLYCSNTNTGWVYAQLYNTAAGGVTVGSTANVAPIGIAPGQTGGFPLSFPGMQFSTAITVAVTTTAGGATAPAIVVDCAAAYN
jgi:hypothetical protein